MAHSVRRLAWIGGAALAVLLGSSFAWALGRARLAPPAPPAVPAAETRLVQQSDELAQRLERDQQDLSDLTRRLGELSPALRAGSLPPPPPPQVVPRRAPLPQVHAITRAS